VAPGQVYALPPSSPDPRSLDGKSLLKLLKATTRTDIVRSLAMDLSFGGLYAEELCLRAGISKSLAPSASTPALVAKLLAAIKSLVSSALSPAVILDPAPIDAVPLQLRYYDGKQQTQTLTFSEALEAVDREAPKKPSRTDAERKRLQAIIDRQEETLIAAKKSAEGQRRKGELIYEHYQDIEKLLKIINDVRKKEGWPAVKKLAKSNKKIKSIDEKTARCVIDLS
jgi:predicted ribosome quality control (RQC) complex YloA/Tae2 family protein